MKNKTLCQLASLCLILGITLAVPVAASAKGKTKLPHAPKKEVPVIHEKVTAISDTSITVTAKEAHTYSIGQFTEILVNGQRGTAKDIKVGMLATVGHDSSNKATNINVHGGS